MSSQFSDIFTARKDSIEKALDKYVAQKNNTQKLIYEAMRYSLLGAGKRIRGVLTLSGGSIAGETEEKIMPVAAAIEMIHAYSLIHDDLPAMDNDDFRRGKPSSHKRFDEATAILAGDALLNGAFELMLSSEIKADRLVDAMKIISFSSGTEGMIGGQVVDMQEKADSLSDLLYIHSHKTVALISAALLGGYTAGGGNDTDVYDSLKKYSVNIGLAFQVIDDILDVTAEEKILGKPTFSDSKNSKKTFIDYKGEEGSRKYARTLTDEAIEIAGSLGKEGEFLSSLAKMLAERKY